jgi:hypothetical protein
VLLRNAPRNVPTRSRNADILRDLFDADGVIAPRRSNDFARGGS